MINIGEKIIKNYLSRYRSMLLIQEVRSIKFLYDNFNDDTKKSCNKVQSSSLDLAGYWIVLYKLNYK